jgi:hypothetical protein
VLNLYHGCRLRLDVSGQASLGALYAPARSSAAIAGTVRRFV